MGYLSISECYENNNNIIYIREALSPLVFKEIESSVFANRFRVGITFEIDDSINMGAKNELIDKIADVIAVGYKYAFFFNRMQTCSLNAFYKDLLITSLISADLIEDKRYIRSKIELNEEFAIDGFYNFKLTQLVKKWQEICNYVPEFFSPRELKDFMMYLISETKGRRVCVDKNLIYDSFGNLLKRSRLLPKSDFAVFKEILLSSAKVLEIKALPPSEEEVKYIKEYFGNKILFKSGENL